MKTVNFLATRVIVSSEKSFEQVTSVIEQIVGQADLTIFQKLVNSTSSFAEVESAVASMTGSSGFMIFAQVEQGALLSLGGKRKNALLYILGNPLIANQMFEQNPAVGLYVPLRLFVYDDYQGKTHVAYDKPSSLLEQFQDEKVAIVAQSLDGKLEELATMAVQ